MIISWFSSHTVLFSEPSYPTVNSGSDDKERHDVLRNTSFINTLAVVYSPSPSSPDPVLPDSSCFYPHMSFLSHLVPQLSCLFLIHPGTPSWAILYLSLLSISWYILVLLIPLSYLIPYVFQASLSPYDSDPANLNVFSQLLSQVHSSLFPVLIYFSFYLRTSRSSILLLILLSSITSYCRIWSLLFLSIPFPFLTLVVFFDPSWPFSIHAELPPTCTYCFPSPPSIILQKSSVTHSLSSPSLLLLLPHSTRHNGSLT